MDRFSLNAMLERLLESDGEDAEAREALAKFTAGMKGSCRWRFHSHVQSPGDKIGGQTNLGTVEIEDDRPVDRKLTLGVREVRIGQFKLTRHRRELEIKHFWKADEETFSETELAEAWRLCMDKQWRPIWFGTRAIKHLFTIPVAGPYVRLTVTQELFLKRWAIKGPDVERGALGIQLYITHK